MCRSHRGRVQLNMSLMVVALIAAGTARADTPIAEQPKPSTIVEPGLHYGKVDGLPLPKTIFFGAGLDDILADAEEWSRHGVNAYFVDYVAREWSTDIWAVDGKPWTIGAADETLQKAKQATAKCRKIGAETFLKVSFDHTFDWFDDVAWQKINHNFRQFAIFARDAGFDGIALDIEYIGQQYHFDWKGYDYKGYTRQDLVKKIDQRMTGVMRILYDEFPHMVFLTFPEQGLGLGSVVHRSWVEEAARRNAPGGFHYCTEYTYRNSNIRYVFGHVWGCHEMFHRILSERAWKYWQKKCSVVAGVWPFSSDDYRLYGPGIPLAQLEQGLAGTLMVSPRYNWIYGSYTQRQLIGRDLDKYTGPENIQAHLQALADRKMVTDPKWVALAKELRQGVLRDYSADLGLIPLPTLLGPSDSVRIQLMPTSPAMPDAHNADYEQAWELGLKLFRGEEVSLRQTFNTITDWMVIGPFGDKQAASGCHDTAYPPETSQNLAAEYTGYEGKKLRWQRLPRDDAKMTVDFKSIFTPTENVCAYALCYITSAEEKKVQIRLGTNDFGKLWVAGKLVYDNPHDGQAILDRDIVPVTLPKGTTPILVKVSNAKVDWGFVFRITDEMGKPQSDLKFRLSPN